MGLLALALQQQGVKARSWMSWQIPIRTDAAHTKARIVDIETADMARAMAAVQGGAGLVLLDEPTAQLDVRGEAEIFERVLTATRSCTTILISHRFSTVRHADRIAVVEDGRVVELGSHDELMRLHGRYWRMFSLQAQRFAAGTPEEGEEEVTFDVLS